MSTTVEVVLERESGSVSWGLNVGRRGTGGAFVVTSVQGSSPATRCREASTGARVEIVAGDEILAVGPEGGGARALDGSTSQAEMRSRFASAGKRARLVLSRGGREEAPGSSLRSWASRVGGKARRSMSVDVRAARRWVMMVASSQQAPRPSEAVALSRRIFVAAGGGRLDEGALRESLRSRLPAVDAGQMSDLGHADALDDPSQFMARVLVLNVGSPSGSRRAVEAGWDAGRGSSTPSLAFAARLGLAACAWLELDPRAVVVVTDAVHGDRYRIGLAAATVLRVVASVTRETTADAALEAYEAYLEAVGGDTKRDLAIDRLPPSFSRALRHVDLAVEARRLPNSRGLALLGVSIRGLPLSDPPVLVVSRDASGWVWSSEDHATEVDWDGDEAFYSLGDDVVLAGDFCVAVKFGGRYGERFAADEQTAFIARYVSSTAFLSDGAIDARAHDVDFHPAYAAAIAAHADDFRLRLAFRYDDRVAPTDFDLPRDADDAVYRGLQVIDQTHATTPDPANLAELEPIAGDPLVASLSLKLAADDLDAAFRVAHALPRLNDVIEKRRIDDAVRSSQSANAAAAAATAAASPAAAPKNTPTPDDGDDDELDAKEAPGLSDFVVVEKRPPEPPVAARRAFGTRAGKSRRTASLPPVPVAPPPPPPAAEPPVSRAPDQPSSSSSGTLSPAAAAPPREPADDSPSAVVAAPTQPADSAPPGVPSTAATTERPVADDNERAAPPAVEDSSQATSAAPPDAAAAAQPVVESSQATSTAPPDAAAAAQPVVVNSSQASSTAPADAAVTATMPASEDSSSQAQPSREAAAEPVVEEPSGGASRAPDGAVSEAKTAEEASARKTAAAAMLAASLGEKAGTGTREEGEASAPLGEHPAMKQWMKLLKVGLPRGAVAKKMVEEGMDPALLDMDLKAAPSPEALAMLRGEKAAPKQQQQRDWSKVKKTTIGKRQSLKPVHWEPLAGGATEGTVWAASESRSVDESEKAELKRLFAVKQSAAKQPSVKKEISQFTGFEACDAKRAANVAIGLQPLSKKFDGDLARVARAARDLDAAALSLENVDQLRPLLPSDAEDAETRRVFRPGNGKEPKRPAEAFFVAVARVVDEGANGVDGVAALRSRLEILGNYLSADEASRKLRDDAAAIESAARAARDSAPLAEALQRLLTIGNALNEGTHRGGAAGFKLASLQRLSTTKSTDSGESVLDFAARKPLAADAFDSLAAPLHRARKLNLNELRADLDRLRKTAAALAALDAGGQAADCAAVAERASAAFDAASAEALKTAKFFGEPTEPLDLPALFGALADFVDDFTAARAKAAAQKDALPSETSPQPKSAEKKREARNKSRSRRGLSVDDVLKSSSTKVRSAVNPN